MAFRNVPYHSTIRAAHHYHTVWDGQAHSTVTVPVPLSLQVVSQTDGGWDGHHPSVTVDARGARQRAG